MADRKMLLDTLRAQLSNINKRLRSCPSLARCKDGGRRDFLAKEFLSKFEGVSLEEFDETLYDWMTGDRPDPRSVQTVLQVLVEVSNDRAIDTVLDCIDTRVGGTSGATPATQDAWWADVVLEPFETAFPRKPRLRKKVKELIHELRKQTSSERSEVVS